MGLDPKLLPSAFLSKIDKGTRKAIGAPATQAESAEKATVKREKELQQRCVAMLRMHGVKLVHVSRMDRRTTCAVGTPDLLFSFPKRGKAFGTPVAIECKMPGCNPSEAQSRVMADMHADGWWVQVVTSEEKMREIIAVLECL